MGIERDDNLIAKLFDSEYVADALLRTKFYLVRKEKLELFFSVSSLEENASAGLRLESYDSPVFDFYFPRVEEIKCVDSTIFVHKKKGGVSIFVANLEEFFFKHDVYPERKDPNLTPGIDGYDDYELLEVFDDADLKNSMGRIENFYAHYKEGYEFKLTLHHELNQVSLMLKQKKDEKFIFEMQFYQIKTLKRDKNSLRFFRHNGEECFNFVVRPFILVNAVM